MIQRKKGLWRGEGGVNEEIETGKAGDIEEGACGDASFLLQRLPGCRVRTLEPLGSLILVETFVTARTNPPWRPTTMRHAGVGPGEEDPSALAPGFTSNMVPEWAWHRRPRPRCAVRRVRPGYRPTRHRRSDRLASPLASAARAPAAQRLAAASHTSARRRFTSHRNASCDALAGSAVACGPRPPPSRPTRAAFRVPRVPKMCLAAQGGFISSRHPPWPIPSRPGPVA